MPYEKFFAAQLEELEAFLDASTPAVRVVAIDGEMRNILMRMLLGLDQDEEFPHILLGHFDSFLDPVSWFEALHQGLEVQLVQHAEEIRSAGMETPEPDPDGTLPSPWRFLRRAQAVAQSLPEELRSLAFIIDPERVEDPAGFVRSIDFLAGNVKSRWLKFIVLDDRSAPRLQQLAADHPRVNTQTFWLDPKDMQRSVDEDLAKSGDAPSSALLGQAAAFASAQHDHSRAVALQWQRIMQVEKEGGAPAEQVLARLDYGRALLGAGHPDPAAETLLQACELCSAHQLHDLAPLAYTELGIALNRSGNVEQSFEALRVGSEFFRAQDNLPGEAHVCDTLAKMHEERGEPAEAERVWRYALSLYEGIANPQLADVRSAGIDDIESKLARLDGGGNGR
jgi:tetratricopeptide (TPR) repeat protein